MIWYLITIISLIQSIFSRPDLRPELLRDAKKAKFTESRWAGGMGLDLRLGKNDASGSSGYGNKEQRDFYASTPDLDQSHVTRVIESNENGPYFWDNESNKSNTHVSWEAIHQMKRKRSQVSIMEQVQIIQVECAVLQRNLESHQKLRLLKDRYTERNAYQTLEDFLKRISYVLILLFYPEKNNKQMVRNIGLPYEELWKCLVSDTNTSIDELEYMMLNFQPQHDPSSRGQYDMLLTQAFSIINFFIKNNMISEGVIEKMINKENIRIEVSSHIIGMFKNETYLGLEFRECLLKSKSTEHLVFVLKLYQEEYLRYVEYEYLKVKIQKLTENWMNLIPPEIYETAIHFSVYNFGKDDGMYMGVKDTIIRRIITHFDNPDFQQSYIRQDVTFDILYHMICFSKRYYPEIFQRFFRNKPASHLLSLKMKISDSVLRWLRNSREVSFIAVKGFWTSEISFSQSEHQIAVKQVKYWKPTLNEEVDNFRSNFRCYIPNEFENWERIFENYCVKGRNHPICVPECVNKSWSHRGGRLLNSFGTNFTLKIKYDKSMNSFGNPPMISRLFLEDLYLWIEKLRIVVENSRENQRIWMKIIQTLSSGMQPHTTEGLRNWLEKSDFIPMVIGEIDCNLRIAQSEWVRIKENMENLNKNILSSMDSQWDSTYKYFYLKGDSMTGDTSNIKLPSSMIGKRFSSMETQEGLEIPEIDFEKMLHSMKDCFINYRRILQFLF